MHLTNCLKSLTPKVEKSCNPSAVWTAPITLTFSFSAFVTKNRFLPVYLQKGSWSLSSKAGSGYSLFFCFHLLLNSTFGQGLCSL